MHLEDIPYNLIPRSQDTVLGVLSLMLILAFDYAFVTGFRSGILGYNPADMTFQFAAPFTRVFNLFVSFPYGVGSLLVFIWLICVNSPVLKWWIGFTAADMAARMAPVEPFTEKKVSCDPKRREANSISFFSNPCGACKLSKPSISVMSMDMAAAIAGWQLAGRRLWPGMWKG